MSRNSRSSFTISWPFIVACIVGYNIFFGDDSDDKKSTDSVDQETPAIVQTTDEKNSIDSTVEKIKNEIKTSVVINQAKEEFLKAKEEFLSKSEEKKSEEIPIPEKPEEESPIMQAEEKEDPPSIVEPQNKETEPSVGIDNMKSL